MRHLGTIALFVVAAVPAACEVYTAPPPGYGYRAQVQVQAPPPPQATVEVNANPDTQPQPQPEQATEQADPNAGGDDQTVDGDPSAVDDFRNALAPYGTWADDPTYGTVWMPSQGVVGADFTPYMSAGHWVYDKDYTWVSDYDWGWGPFHYGRWFQYPGRGWAWIPGKEYAGAWVTWRNGDDGYGYVGWAPTAPSFYYRGGQVYALATPWFEPVYDYAGTGDLFAPSLRARVIRDPVRLREIVGRTRPYAVRGGFVAGTGGLRMRVRGPAPTHLGIVESRVPHLTAQTRGFNHVAEFSRSHPPVVHANVHTVTPTHPPLGNTHGVVQQHPVHEVAHPEPQHTVTQQHGQFEQGHPQTQQPMRQQPQGHTVAPAPSTTTTNVHHPYPGPGVTHAQPSRGTRR